MDFSKGSPEERTDMLSRAFWLYGVGKRFMITQVGRSYRSSGRGAQTQTQDGSNTPPIGITEEEARMLPFDTLHIILEKSVSRTQMMQALDPPGYTKKILTANKVATDFFVMPIESISRPKRLLLVRLAHTSN